jgi:hypothetical protein
MTNATDILSTLGTAGVVLAFVGALVALLERTHRRTAHLPRAPFGTDVEGDRDLARTLAELRESAAGGPVADRHERPSRATTAASKGSCQSVGAPRPVS